MTASTDIDRILRPGLTMRLRTPRRTGSYSAIAAATARTTRGDTGGWHSIAGSSARLGPAIPMRALAVLTLALLLAVAALVVLGSRPRVPPPFGPARPGIFALSIGGDIMAMAPDGTEPAGPDHRPGLGRRPGVLARRNRDRVLVARREVVHLGPRPDQGGWVGAAQPSRSCRLTPEAMGTARQRGVVVARWKVGCLLDRSGQPAAGLRGPRGRIRVLASRRSRPQGTDSGMVA